MGPVVSYFGRFEK